MISLTISLIALSVAFYVAEVQKVVPPPVTLNFSTIHLKGNQTLFLFPWEMNITFYNITNVSDAPFWDLHYRIIHENHTFEWMSLEELEINETFSSSFIILRYPEDTLIDLFSIYGHPEEFYIVEEPITCLINYMKRRLTPEEYKIFREKASKLTELGEVTEISTHTVFDRLEIVVNGKLYAFEP